MDNVADEKWYAGRADDTVVVIQGMTETPLPHHVRHSPDGFSWGYNGSGPAELARCLLIDALGDRACCAECDGTGSVVYIDGRAMSVPAAEAEHSAGEWVNNVYQCMSCDDGIVVEPAMYQRFKSEVIARMTMGQPWSMPRSQVLAWHAAYVTTDSAKAAQEEGNRQ